MKILIVGASKGLGRAFVEGLPNDGDTIFGVSRSVPDPFELQAEVEVEWITADMSTYRTAVDTIDSAVSEIDVLIYNLGIWEETSFSPDYDFVHTPDEENIQLIDTNIIAAILLIKRLIPKMLTSAKPQIVLVGSTSGMANAGQPEVSFGASKHALRGIADALRVGYKADRLAVTLLQIGDLNTDDPLSMPVEQANERFDGAMIPMHDGVAILKTAINLSSTSFVKEIVLPPLMDTRYF